MPTVTRLRPFTATIFAEMSALAVTHDAVNLGQGFPDFPGPDIVKQAAKAAIDADANQYAPSHGTPRFRSAVAAEWSARFGREIDPEREVTVTSGATEAVFDAIQDGIVLDDGKVFGLGLELLVGVLARATHAAHGHLLGSHLLGHLAGGCDCGISACCMAGAAPRVID